MSYVCLFAAVMYMDIKGFFKCCISHLIITITVMELFHASQHSGCISFHSKLGYKY